MNVQRLSGHGFTMFIVRDHREIPDIFKDPKDERVVLAFMRRLE